MLPDPSARGPAQGLATRLVEQERLEHVREVRGVLRPERQAGLPFVEVFVDAPLAVCEQRDPKGLYKKARAGLITNFTGVSAPYEPPESPDVVVHTDRQSVGECVAQIVDFLKQAHIKTGGR